MKICRHYNERKHQEHCSKENILKIQVRKRRESEARLEKKCSAAEAQRLGERREPVTARRSVERKGEQTGIEPGE